jgi:hypothetical protein
MSREPNVAVRAVETGLARCWATLGLPLGVEPVDERKDGVIDLEALVVLTLSVQEDVRLWADVVVWLTLNSDLLLQQKLRLLASLLDETRSGALARSTHSPMLARLPTAVSRALGGSGHRLSAPQHDVGNRARKLAPRGEVARRSIMFRNRLLFGASLRADLVSALQCRHRPQTGRGLARLIGASPSTVSRVLDDLGAAGFLRPDRSPVPRGGTFPGFFISAETVRRLQVILDAVGIQDARLRRAALPDVDRASDLLGFRVAALVRA